VRENVRAGNCQPDQTVRREDVHHDAREVYPFLNQDPIPENRNKDQSQQLQQQRHRDLRWRYPCSPLEESPVRRAFHSDGKTWC
jgi:hypothetical protein